MLDNQLDQIKKDFIKYLDSLGLSAKSHKNYKSDLSHFSGWLILKIRSFGSYVDNLSEAVPFLNNGLAKEYKNYMLENSIASKSINRRLSTLRHLSRFLVSTQVMDQDFMTGIENISSAVPKTVNPNQIIEEFRAHLEAEKASPSTVKNYMSDIRQFLSWLETNSHLIDQTN